jgi:hypothetical protein
MADEWQFDGRFIAAEWRLNGSLMAAQWRPHHTGHAVRMCTLCTMTDMLQDCQGTRKMACKSTPQFKADAKQAGVLQVPHLRLPPTRLIAIRMTCSSASLTSFPAWYSPPRCGGGTLQ